MDHRDLDKLTGAQWTVLQRKAFNWAKEALGFLGQDGKPTGLPTRDEVKHAHFQLWDLLGHLRRGHNWETGAIKTNHTLAFDAKEGKIRGTLLGWDITWPDAFLLQVYESLRDLTKAGYRFRFCLLCKDPFVGKGKQLYCRGHAARARHARWRAANRENLRHKRLEIYKRMKSDLTGIDEDKVTIRAYRRKSSKSE